MAMKTFRIALYPGDGIGVEVIEGAVKVLEAVQARCQQPTRSSTPESAQAGDEGFALTFDHIPWGADYWQRYGSVVPENFLEVLASYDAILMGALGDAARIPDHLTVAPLIKIRQTFDQYAAVRPARLFPGVACPLRIADSEDIDLVVVRENSEGEYVDCGGRFKRGTNDEVANQTAIHTRKGVERIIRFAFDMAIDRRRHLTLVTKSNAMKYGFVLWDEVWEEVRKDYPSVTTEKQHVDAAAMNFVRQPHKLDVVVASNLFADILSDLAGGITGSLGLAPSGNINPTRDFPSLFEPVHGSAPDIAGKGIANPIGAVLSAAMMLEWLGRAQEAVDIRQAVELALERGQKTIDLGGHLNTIEMTDAIIDNLGVSA